MELNIFENPIFEIFRLRPTEKRLTLLLTFYFFVAMATVSIVKALQNALYIGNVGVDWQLPTLYVGLAIISGPLVLFYRFLSKRRSHILITTSTIASLAAGLILFQLLEQSAGAWLYNCFYIWVAICSVLLPTQGWFFSYHLFSPRTAKRVFVVLGAGGVLGGVLGGFYTFLAASHFSSDGLFLHVFGLLAVLEVVLIIVFMTGRGSRRRVSQAEDDRSRQTESAQVIRNVFSSKHLTFMAGVILLTGLVSTIIDLQFKWALDARFEGTVEEITQFFGGLFGVVYLLSGAVQLLATSRILRKFGLGVGLMILPAGMAVSSLGMLATATFWSVILAKVVDGSIRSSVEQTSVELLYVPITDRQSIPVKSFMELVVLRLGDGLGAGLFLLFGSFFSLPTYAVGWSVLVFALVWLLVTRKLGEEYALMLRRSLEFVGSRAVRRALEFSEAVAANTLLVALRSRNWKKVHFALQQLLVQENEADIVDVSRADLSGEVLSVDVSGIYQVRTLPPSWVKSVEVLVDHENPRVGAAALHQMIFHNVPGYMEMLKEKLRSEEVPESRYLLYVQEYAEDPGEILKSRFVLKWCEKANAQQVVDLAYLIGVTQNPTYLPVLRQWLQTGTKAVKRSAIRALGRFRDPADLDSLVEYVSYNWSRRAARRALAAYGEEVVPKLLSLLRDPHVSIAVKRQLPFILTQVNTSSARGVLVAALYTHDAVVAFRALKGLNKIRDVRDLSYTGDAFVPLLQIWAKEYYGLLNIEVFLRSRDSASARLLQKALKERLDWCIEKIFRGLGLFLPHGDAYFSYLGFTSNRHDLQETAIELIDSRVRGELRQTLLPVFAESHPFDVVLKGREIFKLPSDPIEALSEAFYHSDSWLKCCTIAVACTDKLDSLRGLVNQACEDINPLVSETAGWALREWPGTKPGRQERDEKNMLTVVEKVLLLQDMPFFEFVYTEHLGQFASICRDVHASRGMVLFREGEKSDVLVILIDGKVVLESGDQVILEVEEGVLDFWSFFSEKDHQFTARALENCRLLTVSFEDMEDLMTAESELCWAITKHLVRLGGNGALFDLPRWRGRQPD